MKKNLETCFSPSLFEAERHRDSVVVVIDVLRASSAICTAFANGAKAIIPAGTVEEARAYKAQGYLVAAERDGFVLDFADFGNSPFNFTADRVKGRTIAYSTTNGTGIIGAASGSAMTVIGAFVNIGALSSWLVNHGSDVILFCAGWKNRFNLEDAVCAGAYAERLLASGTFATNDDSTKAALDMWTLAAHDLHAYIDKAAQRTRLKEKNLDDCLSYCLTADVTGTIPVIENGVLVAMDRDRY